MDEPPIPIQRPKLDESELAMARPFFQAGVGQKMLQLLRSDLPPVLGRTAEERLAEHEQRLGWDKCYRYILTMLTPTQAQPRQE